MRKLITLLVTVLALVSCNVDKVKDYIYVNSFNASASVPEEEGKAIYDYVTTIPYFTTQHSYHGTYSETFQLASDEFQAAIDKLDEEQIVSHLDEGQVFAIYLVLQENMSPMMAFYFSPDSTEQQAQE